MDWLLNPNFLPPVRNGKRSKRYRDGSDSDDDENENNIKHSNNNSNIDINDAKSNNNARAEQHCSEVDYGDDDNMMYAPIRRQLPPLSVPSTSQNKRGRRTKGYNNDSNGAGGGVALLTSLRAFASKEAAQPGAGVRLFVQACVLSGCDYVPNRLSKVGPVTAFKLVKETSHRDPSVRFERVMKSLPNGSKLLKEPAEDDSGNGDDNNDDDEDDFLSAWKSDSDVTEKEKYLELLSKSEAVFYYHLTKDLANNSIVPLVPHKASGSPSRGDESNRIFSPSLDVFKSDPSLSFIGSAAEALKVQSTPLLPCSQNNSRAIAAHNNNNGGWMASKKYTGPVTNAYSKANNNRQSTKAAQVQAPKSTILTNFLNGSAKTNAINPSTNRVYVPSYARSSTTNKRPSLHSETALSSATNPFADFTHDPANPLFSPDPAKKPANEKKLKRSPMLSPMLTPSRPSSETTFDYGAESGVKSKHFGGSIGAIDNDKDAESDNDSSTKSEGAALAYDGKNICDMSEELKQQPPTESDVSNNVVEEDSFDYEIIPESPPIMPTTRDSAKSKFFSSPRRVSTSPPAHFKDNRLNGGSSPDDAIEIDEGEEEMWGKKETSQTDSQTDKTSVNKRPFKSPYPATTNRSTTTASKKPSRPRPPASAILAGFARQKEICTGSSAKIKSDRITKRPQKKPKGIKDYMKPC
jgi:hypothetical protein